MINTTDKQVKTLKKAIETYGVKSQISKLIEEAGEMIAATARVLNINRIETPIQLSEEIADTLIMIQQMFLLWPVEIQKHYDAKIVRLEKRIEDYIKDQTNLFYGDITE